jgi:hypothetical protein
VRGFPVSRSRARRPREGVRFGVPVIPVERGERVISASSLEGGRLWIGEL